MSSDTETGAQAPLPVRHTVVLVPGGLQFEANNETTLLAAAGKAGVTLPRLCRNGTCRTCMCRMLSGEIRYRIEWPGLSAEEKTEGWVLPCVAYPQSDVVLEADGVLEQAATSPHVE